MQTARKIDPSQIARYGVWMVGMYREVRLHDTEVLVGYVADTEERFEALTGYPSMLSGTRSHDAGFCWMVTGIEALRMFEAGLLIPVEQGEDNAASD